jgi:hypothetical protein
VLSATPSRQTNFFKILYTSDWLVVDYISGTWSDRTGHVQAPGVTNDAAQLYCWTWRENLQLIMVYNPFLVYGFQNRRTNRCKRLSYTHKRLPSHLLVSSLKTSSRSTQHQQQCVKRASSSGPAVAPTSKIHVPATKPASATKPATATLSPGHIAPRSPYTHRSAAPPASAPTKPRHSEKQTKLSLPDHPPTLLCSPWLLATTAIESEQGDRGFRARHQGHRSTRCRTIGRVR